MRYVKGHHTSEVPANASWYTVEDRGYETPCWIWRRRVSKTGHPLLNIPGVQHYPAYRHLYEERHGKLPKSKVVHHLCAVKRCVNPSHMEPLSKGEHRIVHAVMDMEKKKAEAISLLKYHGFNAKDLSRYFHVSLGVVKALPSIHKAEAGLGRKPN